MPYLGSTPNASFSTRTKQDFTANGSTKAFTLSSAVASANDIEVFVGNVRQEPTDAYTVNGTTLTMSEAPETGLNFYVVFKGLEENSIIPADGTISSAKIVSGAVTDAKIASNAVTTAKIANSAITDAKIAGVATTKLSYSAGDVVQQLHTTVQTHPHPSNANGHIAFDGNGLITETTAYNSASLTPLLQLAITKKITSSNLIVKLTGRFSINTGYRSQIALHDGYTAGQVSAAGGATNIMYQHFGLYNASGGDIYHPGAFEVTITGISANTAKTYYWFGGSITGTQRYAGLAMTITEIAI